MKRRFFTLASFLIAGVLALSAQSYAQLWKQIGQAERDGKPKTAIEAAQQIFQKAQQERLAPQMMQAYLTAMAHRKHLSIDSLYIDIEGLEKWVADPITPVSDAAMLHSLLGSIYAYSERGRYAYKPVPELPEDMSEWSRQMYRRRAFEHFVASTAHLEELRGYSTLTYSPITYTGKWSDYYQHDLMHLIGRRAAFGIQGLENGLRISYKQTGWDSFTLDYERFKDDTLTLASAYDCPTQAMRIFQRMLAAIDPEEQTGAWISMEQNRMNLIPKHQRDTDEHLRLLLEMKKRFEGHELCGSICLDIATIYRDKRLYPEALEILNEGIEKYPTYGAINLLRNMEKEIRQPYFNMRSTSPHYYPGDSARLNISHRNLTRFTVWLRRVENCPLDTLYKYRNQAEALKGYSKFHSEHKYLLTKDAKLLQADTLVALPLPTEAGVYLIEGIANGKGTNLSSLTVSPYRIVSHNLPGGLAEYAVLDGKSGHPIADATIQTAEYDEKQKRLIPAVVKQTNKHGCAAITTGRKRGLIRVSTASDNSMPYLDAAGHLQWNRHEERTQLVTRLLSDRTHFRPGQTIYIKGINYWQLPGDSIRAAGEHRFTLRLKDGKGNILQQKEVVTNEFGSYTAEFVLPDNALNGAYHINSQGKGQANGASLIFHIEEYKLPTFEVTLDKVETAYAVGDTVTLTGRATTYSGVPVADGKVSYNIVRNYRGWLRGWSEYWFDDDSAQGEATTDGDGRFSIKVFMDKREQAEESCWWRNECHISCTVTSMAGESQGANTTLELSSCPLKMTIEGDEGNWLKGKPHPLTFRVTNLSGEPIDTEVDYRIYLTDEREKPGRTIHQGRTTANQPLSLDFLDQQPSALYKVVATTAPEGKRDSVQSDRTFLIHAENETKVPLGKDEWFNWLEHEVAVGEPARLQFGTREKDAFILMDVFSELKRISSRRFYLSDTVQTFTFDYLPKYGKGMSVSIMYVKDGQIHSHTHALAKKLPEKTLEVKWETFRNRLTPGTREEWTLTINRPDGTPADAELLASMHDASLDKLRRQRGWYFRLNYFNRHIPTSWWYAINNRNLSAYINFDLLTKKVPTQYRYDDIVQRYFNFDLPFLRKGAVAVLESTDAAMGAQLHATSMAKSARIGSTRNLSMDAPEREEEVFQVIEDNESREHYTPLTTSPEALPQGMALRENFTETAFFQPHLRTDSTGRVKVSFTLPDNLTRWHFRALAHTRQMDVGMLEDFATAQREFMVQPNLPRFVRTGDKTTIHATLSNLSEKDIKGTARMELIDPLTEKVILSRKAKFNTEAGKTSTVSFAFTIDNTDVPLPICRIVADGGKFSDGEQRYLPVLTNKVWITESQPLMVNGPGTVTESLTHLFNHHSPTATNQHLTVEVTGNPMWTAIQALPTVATPTTEDAFAWTSAWYAHSIASYIAQSNPRIKALFDQWKANDKESLWSNLQKNQELKSLLLTETPWVTDATDEATQMRQLALLFDKSHADSRIALYLNKMQALQNPDGGWSWYKGMGSSRYVTTCILELMERVIYLTGNGADELTLQMRKSATDYLSKELLREYQQLQKQEKESKDIRPSELTLHYLSSLALNGKRLGKSAQKATDYMVAKLPDQLNALTSYGKAKASIILKHHGKQDEAARFLTSLKEHTTYTPEMGRYFDNPQPYESWRDNRLPAQVATIEALAFSENGDTLSIEQMKQWLLIQKQTQHWGNPLNTVDAIHALLMEVDKKQADKLTSPSSANSSSTRQLVNLSTCQLKLDGKSLSSTIAPTPGIDYQKYTYPTTELKELPREATLEKQTTGLAWGAVYAQYLEDMDKAASTYTGRTATAYGKKLDQPLSIERTWLIEHIIEGEKGWIPLTEGMELHVGDKVMSHLTIRADRAMDFVQIKDSRAACLEPVSTASGYRFNGGLGHYCSVKDAAILYFIDHLPKGTYTLEQTFHIDRTGRYQAGIATVQCAYAPEFVGHTAGTELRVE